MTVTSAEVFRAGVPAATLTRRADGVHFRYRADYLERGGASIATTLPTDRLELVTPSGAVPPFFAGLLPEGRRLSGLRRAVKASADDELSLLCAVGSDTVGDVQVFDADDTTTAAEPLLDIGPSSTLDFRRLVGDLAPVDRVGLAGVQDKVSGRMIIVPARHAAKRFILKLNPPEYPHVVENEQFFLQLSRSCGLPTVESRVIRDHQGLSGLLVTRFDRVVRDGSPVSLPVEDGCQVLGRWPADKYAVATGVVFKALARLCASELVAARDLFRQLCFAILTGNGDLHAKNVSVVGSSDGEWRIAPAYDLPSTAFYGDSTLALSLDGRRSGVSRRQLLDFAESIGLRRPAARRWLDDLLDGTDDLIPDLESGALPFDEAVTHSAVRRLRNNRRLLSEGS